MADISQELEDYLILLRRTSYANVKLTETLLGVLKVIQEYSPPDPCEGEDRCPDCQFISTLCQTINEGLGREDP